VNALAGHHESSGRDDGLSEAGHLHSDGKVHALGPGEFLQFLGHHHGAQHHVNQMQGRPVPHGEIGRHRQGTGGGLGPIERNQDVLHRDASRSA
jgi:hypothetical protein